jgi:fumarate hydratase class II
VVAVGIDLIAQIQVHQLLRTALIAGRAQQQAALEAGRRHRQHASPLPSAPGQVLHGYFDIVEEDFGEVLAATWHEWDAR